MAEDNTRHRLYDLILGHGEAGQAAYYNALRAAGIAPTPADEPGHLYAPNPVIVPGSIVEAMVHDLNLFCQERRAALSTATDLLSPLPEVIRNHFASTDVAAQIFESLKLRHPFACLDAYLVQTERGLDRAYLEWQTFPAYPALGLKALECVNQTFPGLEESGGFFGDLPGETLSDIREKLRRILLRGISDPVQTVVVDLTPEKQVTRREFYAMQELSGGRDKGFGIIDPREVFYRDGRPCYRRQGREIPIQHAMSRLVHSDLSEQLWPVLSPAEREPLSRFFQDGLNVRWIVHPIHFLYGSKADFPGFYDRGLSTALPACRMVTPDLLEQKKLRPDARMRGMVMKPVTGCGGRDILVEPLIRDLSEGAILQEMIQPAECHRTLAGPRAPEIRVMGLPDGDGRLTSPVLFARVKAPHIFKSNAGATAEANVAGTGEGYALRAGS